MVGMTDGWMAGGEHATVDGLGRNIDCVVSFAASLSRQLVGSVAS